MAKDDGKRFYEETSAIHKMMLNFEYMNKQCMKLGRVECNVLHFLLQKKRPVNMKEIAGHINVSYSRITHLIDSLLKKGFVTRISGVDDRRVYFAQITPEGISIVGAYKNNNEAMFNDFVNNLPKEKVEAIYKSLEYWLQILNKMNYELKILN
ncbi:MAG: MarR family transcriptional regulator [Candidatus Cloacimonetes bacterium]|nr:MarR family transcriptional regulator [Candidatus Cloacimonadota bacterium]